MKKGIILPPEEDGEAKDIFALFNRVGEEETEAILLESGHNMISDGKREVAATFMDVAFRFRQFARHGNSEQFLDVAAMLRRTAQTLHRKQPADPKDARFLRLVVDNGGRVREA